MDPLTISTTVLGIAGKCVTVAKELSALRDKYKHAGLTISAICSESAVVNAALCKLQNLFDNSQDGEAFERFQSRPDLAAACDTALTGCTLLYSCLDDEVRSLHVALETTAGLSRTQKVKTVWKEDTMKELLQQIRGQTSALNLLVQCFHFEYALETQNLLRNQGAAIDQIKSNMSVLRSAYPSKKDMPESVLEDKRSIQAVFADNASIIGEAEFSFDDIVINSRAYRQAMAAAMSYAKGRASSASQVNIPEQSSASPLQEVNESLDTQADSLHAITTPGAVGHLVAGPHDFLDRLRVGWAGGETPELEVQFLGELPRLGNGGPLITTPAPGLSTDLQPRVSVLARTMNNPRRPYWSRGAGIPSASTTQHPTYEDAKTHAQSQDVGAARQEQGDLHTEVHTTFNADFARTMELPSFAKSASPSWDSVDWVKLLDYEGLVVADMSEVPKPVIEFQIIWWEILTGERDHICFLRAAKHVFLDQILTRWPKVVQAPQQFVDEVFDGMEDLQKVHTECLYNPLVAHWMRYGVWAPFDPKPFADMLDHASDMIRRYCSNFVMAQQRVAMECSFNPGFRGFLDSQRAHPAARRLEWQYFHKAPITRLQRYSLLLETLRNKSKKRPDGYRMSPRYPRVEVLEVERQLDEIVSRLRHLTLQCDDIIDKASQQQEQLAIRACFRPREYIISRPADLDWLAYAQIDGKTDCLQAFCLFQGHEQDMEWAWCNFFFPDDGSLVIVDIWDWLDPTHRCRNPLQTPTSGALSVKLILHRKQFALQRDIKSLRKLFGIFSKDVPREAGEAYFKVDYMWGAYGTDLRYGSITVTGKSINLDIFVKKISDPPR